MPDSPQSAMDFVLYVVKILSAPVPLAIVMSIGITQAIKVYRRQHKKMPKGAVWVLAWITTAIIFPFVGLLLGMPWNASIPTGILAGFISPIIVAFAQKRGYDVDHFFGGKK